jgi:ribA/ribD-fused uncharacterized protein
MIDKFDGPFRFLSNFYPCEIVDDYGFKYGSVEAAYQASKTLDLALRKKFTELGPGAAKRLGKLLVIRDDWTNYLKVSIMFIFLTQKFSRVDLKVYLLSTGGHELIEGNTWGDRFWGVCDGEGENNLGELLMMVRDDISNKYENEDVNKSMDLLERIVDEDSDNR